MNCRGHTYRIKILTDVKYFITNSLNIKGKKKKKKTLKVYKVIILVLIRNMHTHLFKLQWQLKTNNHTLILVMQ